MLGGLFLVIGFVVIFGLVGFIVMINIYKCFLFILGLSFIIVVSIFLKIILFFVVIFVVVGYVVIYFVFVSMIGFVF